MQLSLMRARIEKSGLWSAMTLVLALSVFFASGCKESDDNTGTRKIVMINLGDSYGNGVQSGAGNVNQHTQINSYPQILAEQIRRVLTLEWENPLLDMEKKRLDATLIPHNVAVDGATVKSLLEETSDEWDYIAELLQPIPVTTGAPVTQLDAAEYVAGLYDDSDLKIITLFIGGNDIMGTVIAGNGTELTSDAISAFLEDTENGHDLDSVKSNLNTIVERLTRIPNSHVFVANIPSVTGIAGLLNADDIERMAVFDSPEVSLLSEDQYIGLGPFIGLAPVLAADNTYLNGGIQQILGVDGYYLTGDEISLISTRAAEISAHISDLVSQYDNLYLVDVVSMFDKILAGEVSVGGTVIGRGYNAGMFSMDGFHPSNTGYALIADEFIKTINLTGIVEEVPQVDLESVWNNDPYNDKDGDGYIAGPGLAPGGESIIDITFTALLDCDDTDNTVFAPFSGNGLTGICQ